MKNVLLIIFLIKFLSPVSAQTCTCSSNFEWIRSTFEANDAGFDYILRQKGQAEYKKHSDLFALKTATITDMTSCLETCYEWLSFFRKGHIAIQSISNTPVLSANSASVAATSEKYPLQTDWLKNYGDTFQIADYRGLWQTGPYTIAIIKQAKGWWGVIVESKNEAWKPGDVKLKITEPTEGVSSVYYMGDHSLRTIQSTKLIGKNHLQMDFIALKRLNSKWQDEPAMSLHLRCKEAQHPFCERINKTTGLVRIPSFNESEKKKIDSMLHASSNLLSRVENLIIDLRNNGGGSDMSYQALLPYIVTNPIRELGVKYKSTPLNNTRMLELSTDPDWPLDEQQWAKRAYDTLQKHLGEFIDLDPKEQVDVTIEPAKKAPKQIIVIMNENCGSTTEQFLLAAKQSKKVKLLGTSSFGALDISNMHFVPDPCNQFKLGYCLSISKRLPDLIIDDRGLQPDFLMDRAIDETLWIEYALKILNAK